MNDMDAQNAVEPTTSRPAVPDRRPEDIRKSTLDIPSSPPVKHALPPPGADDEANSDTETVILPGKDGFSPSKTRKVVNRAGDRKQPLDDVPAAGSRGSNGDQRPQARERDRDRERERDRGRDYDRIPGSRSGMGGLSAEAASSLVAKKKKPLQDKQRTALKDNNSSGLSSAPGSPPPPSSKRRLLDQKSHGDSDSESSRPKSPKLSKDRDRSRTGERVVPHKRKASTKADSDDEGDPNRKVRRQRLSSHSTDLSTTAGKQHAREPKTSSSRAHQPPDSHGAASRTRSTSPHQKPHRRSLSTQLSSSNGLGQKKKRVPPPLTTDYHSDDSSASGSPHPRSLKLKSLTTPATADSTISPAKIAPHKKHLDAHGQTLLARACARGEYDLARSRLLERLEDLNVADYAGNTPLQIASLHGHEEIVKLLIDSGCALDCVNNDRDTPLLDAVDNGHLEVIKLLLDAGVNPRKTNLNGEEPLDRVSDDLDNAEEIRAVIREARNKPSAAWRRASEEHHGHEQSPQEPHPPDRHSRDPRSHGPESPRHSPAAISNAAMGRRAATSRSNKTSNSQLYKPLDDKTLRQAACRGDEETVLRILQVKDKFNDPESMVGAARGGHETVMQYLLALGGCNPDPDPVPHLTQDASTPMLAAIGQGTLGIVRLLLAQPNFDPTRKFKGETYHEIARRRQGPDWEEEEEVLKEAYDKHKKSHRVSQKDRSPGRRPLVKERPARTEFREEVHRAYKRKASSPGREGTKAKTMPGKATSPKEKKRTSSFSANEEQAASKRGPGRPRKDIPAIAISNRGDSPQAVAKAPANKVKRQETDHGANSSEGEATAARPRRKLVSGRELKDERERERERQRRSSMVSNNSAKEGSSPKEKDDAAEKPKTELPSEKYHDRAKAIRRDDSRDRLSVTGDGSAKRHRSSVTPPRHGSGDKDDGEAPVKRRRLDVECKEKRQRSSNSSPEDRHRKPSSLRDSTPSGSKPSTLKDSAEKEARREAIKAKKLAAKASQPVDKPVIIKSEDVDMADAPAIKTEDDSDLKARREEERERRAKLKAAEARRREDEQKRLDEERKQKEEERKQREVEEARKLEGERRRKEAEEQRRQEEEEHRRREEEERRRREEEERRRREEEERQRREEEERRRREEEERRRQEEEERRRREEEERRRREEEEQKRKEEEERRRKEEEEKIRREEERKRREEERKRQEEEERVRREEEARRLREKEARLREEQLEREAAEAARRREAEERERRLAEEAEQRRIREEQERIRLSSLPPLLRWFDGCEDPKSRKVAERFTSMHGVRYDTIVPDATGSAETLRELWVLNTHVALLLGDKDLRLSNYPLWPRLPASHIAKTEIYGVEAGSYALIAKPFWDLAQELPGYFGKLNGSRGLKMAKDRAETFKLFDAMDLFFVRVADFMRVVPTMAHLRDLEISVQYKELPLNEEMRKRMQLPLRWKHDPFWADRNHGAAPGAFVYVNGEFVHETKTGHLYRTSTTPFPDGPVPRRGFTAVSRHDPEYERLCREQGLEHLLGQNGHLPNGVHHSSSPVSPRHFHALTPVTPGPTEPAESDVAAQVLPNGINGYHE